MVLVEAQTLGQGWLEVSRQILAEGDDESYDGLATKELALVTLIVEDPDPEDALIASLADADWLDWMRQNFTEPGDVAELGGARSYARRLRDYEGRDQIAWVVDRLRADPATRSATITTFQPLTDTSYIPCVSLLDFWRVSGALEQPRGAGAAAAGGRRGSRHTGRAAGDPHEVRARLRARVRGDEAHDDGHRLKFETTVCRSHLTWWVAAALER
jgi:hypothetical protein